jgi:preprotein translocase subunit SecG
MFQFLLVVHVIIAISMVGVILMQRSEGGGLTGGSPAGLMSARGAADFLTRTTTILATLFVGLSIALATYATVSRAPKTIDTSLSRKKGSLDANAPGVVPTTSGASNAVAAPPVPMADPGASTAPAIPSTAVAPQMKPDAAKQDQPTAKAEDKRATLKIEPKAIVAKPDKPKLNTIPPIEKPVVKVPDVPKPDATTKVPEGLIPPGNPQ